MKVKLTEKLVATTVAETRDAGTVRRVWDAGVPGLALKVRPTGAASWIVTYRPAGGGRGVTSRTVTLGTWPAVGIDAARVAARGTIGAVAAGKDVAADRRQSRTREKRILKAALDDYEKFRKREQFVNVPMTMSVLRRGLAPLAAREIDTLTSVEIIERINALEDAGKPGAAADLRRCTRRFFGWAKSKGLIGTNPLADYRKPRMSRATRLAADGRKGRALDDNQIERVWRAAGAQGAFGALVRLGLLTALRRAELAGLRWSDIDTDSIRIRAERAKTGAEHLVPLTASMKAILAALPRTTSDLVFPSDKTGGPMSGWSKMGPRLAKSAGVPFTLHDLRRSCRTLMSRLGIAENIAERAIGHARDGLVATYDKSDLWSERVAAFEAVSDHITAILTPQGGNVVPLKGNRA